MCFFFRCFFKMLLIKCIFGIFPYIPLLFCFVTCKVIMILISHLVRQIFSQALELLGGRRRVCFLSRVS